MIDPTARAPTGGAGGFPWAGVEIITVDYRNRKFKKGVTRPAARGQETKTRSGTVAAIEQLAAPKTPEGFLYAEAQGDRDPEAAKRQRLKSRITLAPVKGYWP